MRPARTLMLVADAGRARAYLALGHTVSAIDGFALDEEVPPSREIGDDRPGRAGESVGPTRHAYEPRTDPHREVKRRFAETIAARLQALAASVPFDRLPLIAPPAMLSDLRTALGDELKKRVHVEIDKDLTKLPEAELITRLGTIAAGET